MTLDDYLTTEKITGADFGSRMDPPISEASVSRIRRGEQNITLEVMRRIIEASNGKVTADGLMITPAARIGIEQPPSEQPAEAA